MVAAPAHQPHVDPLDEAEAVILDLCAVLLGDPTRPGDRGLLNLVIDGRQHAPRCPFGQWLTPGLGGDPCSSRCVAAHEAISAAERWLMAREAAS